MAKKTNNLLAVDVGSSAVKVVELAKTGKSYRIEAAAIEAMPNGIWKDGLPIESEACAMTIQRAIKASGSSLKEVIVSMPTSASMSRVLPIASSLKEDDIELTLEAGLSQYIPFSADEVSFDFNVLGSTFSAKDTNDVLLVAVQKEFINNRDICFETAGYKMKVADIDIYALMNLIHLLEPISHYSSTQAIGIIEIGADRTGLHIVHSDGSVYAREQPYGGDRLTEIISDQTGMPFEQASQKKKSGLWQDAAMTQALDLYFGELAEQMVTALQVYQSNHPRIEIQKVFIAGGGAQVPSVDSVLSSHLNLSTTILDISTLFTLGNKCRVSMSDIRSLSIACGLALRNFV